MSKLTDLIEANVAAASQRTAAMMGCPVLSQDKVIKHIHAQAKSADMWIQQWEQYKDVSSVRYASLAIGKLFGMYNALLAMNGGNYNAPEDIIAMMQKYQHICDTLYILPSTANLRTQFSRSDLDLCTRNAPHMCIVKR